MGIFDKYSSDFLYDRIISTEMQAQRMYKEFTEKIDKLQKKIYDLENPPKFKPGDMVSGFVFLEPYISGVRKFTFNNAVISEYIGSGKYAIVGVKGHAYESNLTLVCSAEKRCEEVQNQAKS